MTSKRTKALGISAEVREAVSKRDNGCIFRKLGGCYGGLQCMHFIPRSAGGLGIPKNLAMGCVAHHMKLDQSAERKKMSEYFGNYLSSIYPDWNIDDLTYRRWL